MCLHGHVSLLTYMYLYSALPLENLLLNKFNAFSLSLNAYSVVCYIQRAVQTEQFMLFQIRCGDPLAPKYFLLSFNGTPHLLG